MIKQSTNFCTFLWPKKTVLIRDTFLQCELNWIVREGGGRGWGTTNRRDDSRVSYRIFFAGEEATLVP